MLPANETTTQRERVSKFERTLQALPDAFKVDIETMHLFCKGLYARTVLMTAGSIVVGKIHKCEHVVVVSKGRARVNADELGETFDIGPGSVFVCPPGSRRTLLILEDMLWTTIHATNERDLVKLEEELIAKDYNEVPEEKFSGEMRVTKQSFLVGDGTAGLLDSVGE